MNLLEKAKEIIEWNKYGFYENLKDTDIGKYAPAVCRALVEAMEEIDKQSARFYPPRCESEFYYYNGVDAALSILRRHLEVEK
jgi:hypothetical protein